MFRRPAQWLVIVGVVALAGCAGPSVIASRTPASAPLTPAASPALASPAVTPVASVASVASAATPAPSALAFTSLLYDYSITLPADWQVGAAMLQWDGASAPGHDDGSVDKFAGLSTVSVAGYVAPVTVDLDGFAKDNIAWTVHDHGDTCPAAPETTESIQIGGESGVLQSWNCGILINDALIVHNGKGYVFVMRDPGVAAATDASDRALFEDLLDSVQFPT